MLTGFESGLHMLERRIDRVKDFGKESLRVAQSIQAGNLALGNVISQKRKKLLARRQLNLSWVPDGSWSLAS